MAKRDMSGSLSKNKRKEKDTHADLKGLAMIGGKEFWISAWKKTGDDGPWLSLAFEVKEDKPDAPRRPQRTTSPDDPW